VVARVIHVELHIAPMIRIIVCYPQAWVAEDKEMIFPKLCGSTHSVLLQVSTISSKRSQEDVCVSVQAMVFMMPIVNGASNSTVPPRSSNGRLEFYLLLCRGLCNLGPLHGLNGTLPVDCHTVLINHFEHRQELLARYR